MSDSSVLSAVTEDNSVVVGYGGEEGGGGGGGRASMPSGSATAEANGQEEEEEGDDDIDDGYDEEMDGAEAERLLQSSLELFESTEKDVVDEAVKPLGGARKLSQFIGIESLGLYPPREFQVAWAAREAAEAAARVQAKLRKSMRRADARREKEAAREAKRAERELAKDPFNVELLERTGKVDVARKLRNRRARREAIWEGFMRKKAEQQENSENQDAAKYDVEEAED